MALVADPNTIEANLVPQDATAAPSAPAPAPREPDFSILREQFAEIEADDSHPLDVEPAVEVHVSPSGVTPPVTPEIKAPEISVPQHQPHPQDLIDAARNLGIEDRFLAPGAVPTQALLDFVVKMRLKDSILEGHVNAHKTEPVKPIVSEEDTLLAELEGELDPRLAKLVRMQSETIKKLQSREDPEITVQKVLAQRDARTASERAIDASFSSLGPKFEKIFGKGSLGEMADGPQKSKRLRVYTAAGLDLARDNPATIKQKIAAAANDLFGDVIPDPTPEPAGVGAYGANGTPAKTKDGKTPVQIKEEWDRAALGRPAGKPPSKQEAGTRQLLHDAMRDMGYGGGDNRTEEFEGVG